MEKMTGKSLDLIAENIAQLKALFPEAVTEGKIDFEVLQAILGGEIEKRQTYYKFTWNGKEEARAYARIPSMGTLRPCVEESSGKDGTPGKFDSENLYIEGDNLEVLKLLQGAYHKKVKMIYIDPPYNTGKDFVYPDNFRDSIGNYKSLTGQTDEEGAATRANPETSGRYHTDWLNMMYPRLILARSLLSDDGVIFISIDDNEFSNLKKICDDVFGEDNYLNQFAWVVNITGRQISGSGAAKTWESILVYAKNIDNVDLLSIDIAFAKEKMPDAYKGFDKDIRKDARGDFAVGDTLYNHNRKFNEETRRNLVFSIFYNPKTEEIIPGDIGEKKDGFIEIPPHKNGDGIHKYHAWRWSRQKIESESYDLIVQQAPSGKYEVYTRIRDFSNTTLKDLITNISNGDSEVQSLFDGKKYFDYPKSVNLLITLLGSMIDKDATILDFFSGSATTAHAVMQLNAEDGGHRKFIMVQLPEVCEEGTEAAKAGYKNICEIGKERIRRTARKIREENSLTTQNQDLGFKVFKLDTSNLIPWNPEPDKIELLLRNAVENILVDRTRQDLLYEVLLKCNLPLTLPIEERNFGDNTVYVVGAGALAICLDTKIPQTIAEEIVKLRDEYAPVVPMQVVFRDNGFTDVTKTNALQILKQAGFEEKSVQTI